MLLRDGNLPVTQGQPHPAAACACSVCWTLSGVRGGAAAYRVQLPRERWSHRGYHVLRRCDSLLQPSSRCVVRIGVTESLRWTPKDARTRCAACPSQTAQSLLGYFSAWNCDFAEGESRLLHQHCHCAAIAHVATRQGNRSVQALSNQTRVGLTTKQCYNLHHGWKLFSPASGARSQRYSSICI